jgi:hypothetical protein
MVVGHAGGFCFSGRAITHLLCLPARSSTTDIVVVFAFVISLHAIVTRGL